MPFDFECFYNDPRWSAEATQFEQCLGAYYFNDPQATDAARAEPCAGGHGITGMRERTASWEAS
ncbi:hypothetical protein ACTMTI_54010 [Nonomuraea sp. H19]|uniref:hypothetical protein n=1 Tax=Nonomuraea sp. H19 TaxID=3452206 RepID=UPI003F89DA20